MEKLKHKITLLLLLIGFGLFLCLRYYLIDIDINEIVCFALFYFFSIATLFISFKFYDQFINPISIYFPFLFCVSYSFIRLSIDQTPYTLNTIIIVILSISSYILAAMAKLAPKKIRTGKSFTKRTRRLILYFIFAAAVITFILEIRLVGYIPILNVTNADIYKELNKNIIPFLHYFVMILAFFPAWVYIMRKQRIISKREFQLFLIGAFLILINYLSRQIYLMMALSFIFAYLYYNKIHVGRLAIYIGSFLILFIIVAILRFSSMETSIDIAEFYRLLAGIDNDNITFFEAMFSEYSSKRFGVLNDVISYADEIDFWGIGMYAFKPIVSLLFLEDLGLVTTIPKLNTEVEVATYLADPYLDFRYLGVIIINFSYGFISNLFYNKIKNREETGIVGFSIISFCLIMGMFINYFNTLFIWISLIFNRLLIKSS